VQGGIREQTEQVLKNIGLILTAAGYSFADVVKTTCMLADINDFAAMNEVYAKYFVKDFPARSTFQAAALPKGVLVEIEVIAAKK
jgi:2-iminobutanoate/2-iminopropanoate deaminase